MVPIQIASQRCGVTPHVIRIWERRYRALKPSRTGTNRRMYSEEDLRRLRLLAELTTRGYRIGCIAELEEEELAALARKERENGRPQPAAAASPATLSAEHHVKACLQAAREFDGDALRQLLLNARLELGQRGLLCQVLAPLIAEIGSAWQRGELRSGQEHLGTAVIRELLMPPPPGSHTASGAPELVVATPCGELHELGALLVAASARDLGWKAQYLGPNLPAEEIAACAKARHAQAVALSVVYPDNCPTVLAQIRELRGLIPAGTLLLVGGRAASAYQRQAGGQETGIHWMSDLPGLDRLLVDLQSRAAA